jgi:prepilin-type N-terminal cleavage/methylation domain-containing protein
MRSHSGHTLVEVIVALALVSLALVGAAATVARATAWRTAARLRVDQIDDLRVGLAVVQRHGCLPGIPDQAASDRPVDISAVRDGALQIATLRAESHGVPVELTITQFCP